MITSSSAIHTDATELSNTNNTSSQVTAESILDQLEELTLASINSVQRFASLLMSSNQNESASYLTSIKENEAPAQGADRTAKLSTSQKEQQTQNNNRSSQVNINPNPIDLMAARQLEATMYDMDGLPAAAIEQGKLKKRAGAKAGGNGKSSTPTTRGTASKKKSISAHLLGVYRRLFKKRDQQQQQKNKSQKKANKKLIKNGLK